MKQQRVNVQTIAEVLIEELDKLESTAKRIESALPAIDKRLQQLQHTKVELDTKSAEAVLRRFETLSQQNESYPRWLVIYGLIATLLAASGLFWGWSEQSKAEGLQQVREIHEQYLQDIQQVEQYNDWVKQRQ